MKEKHLSTTLSHGLRRNTMYQSQWGNCSQGLGSALIKAGIQNRSSVSSLGLTAHHIISAQGCVWTVYFSQLVLSVPLFPHPALLRTSFCSWQRECQHFINMCKHYIGLNIHTCITLSRLHFYLQLLIWIASFRYRILSSRPIIWGRAPLILYNCKTLVQLCLPEVPLSSLKIILKKHHQQELPACQVTHPETTWAITGQSHLGLRAVLVSNLLQMLQPWQSQQRSLCSGYSQAEALGVVSLDLRAHNQSKLPSHTQYCSQNLQFQPRGSAQSCDSVLGGIQRNTLVL